MALARDRRTRSAAQKIEVHTLVGLQHAVNVQLVVTPGKLAVRR
jgi:hypothetical protein